MIIISEYSPNYKEDNKNSNSIFSTEFAYEWDFYFSFFVYCVVDVYVTHIPA